MPIYCDESGGVGRGVMTLAAIMIDAEVAEKLLVDFRTYSGLTSELKGSRIDLEERGYFYELFEKCGAHGIVSIALSALKPVAGEDRGEHDISIYGKLLDDAVAALLPQTSGCAQVIIDDGRYGPATLANVRDDIGRMVGPCGMAKLELSHRSPGLQIADVVANSFFNRALVNDRQARFAGLVEPFLTSGKIEMRVLTSDA